MRSDPCHTAQNLALQQDAHVNMNAALPHQEVLRTRTNVIIVGDSVGDAQMGDGVVHDNMLRIGLCNRLMLTDVDGELKMRLMYASDTPDDKEHCQAILDEYLDAFDIVISGDVGFDTCLLPLIKLICSQEQ
jgi:hypothetical protein